MTLNLYLFCMMCLYLSNLNLTSTSLKEPEIIVNLRSVTSFKGLEQFYQRLRDETSGPFRRITTGVGSSPDNPTPPLDTYTKSQLCKQIFARSFHFAEERLVNPDDVRQELKDRYRRIFWEIFNTKIEKQLLKKIYRYEFANDSCTYSVLLAGAQKEEKAFTCLVQERQQPKRLKRYLVSDYEYDVTETGGFYVIGRFIFVENKAHQLVVHALAEEPAVTVKKGTKNADEIEYLLKRAIDSPEKNAENDPICQLTPGKKMRLCTSVLTGLSMKLSENILKFVPDLSNVEFECGMKRVVILTASLDPDTDAYDEWLIGCKATEEDEQTTFYISQGYEQNEVMVFKAAGPDKVNVHHISRKAGVITVVAPEEPEPSEPHLCEECQHDAGQDSD